MTRPVPHYFALTRLLAREGPNARSEQSACEAYLGAATFFTVTYFFIAAPLFAEISIGRIVLALLFAPFVVCILWLILLYVNAVLRNALVRLGAATSLAARDFQHVMMCIWLTIFSVSLARNDHWFRWVGLGWCALLSLEILATLLQRYLNERADRPA